MLLSTVKLQLLVLVIISTIHQYVTDAFYQGYKSLQLQRFTSRNKANLYHLVNVKLSCSSDGSSNIGSSRNDFDYEGIKNGLMLRCEDVGENVLSLGVPRVVSPSNELEDWLLWFNCRDETDPKSLVGISTGKVMFASSKDGLTNWKLHPDCPVLDASKKDDNWFVFDSEHTGVGDIIQPGRTALSKFADQGNVFLMYHFGGNGEMVNPM